MAGVYDTVTGFINSPPGVVVAGAALAGIVWKFFERVEAGLHDQTKFEIAVWLVGVELGKKIAPWPATFVKVFHRVFGNRQFSWQCFYRSVLVSCITALICGVLLPFAREYEKSMSFIDFFIAIVLATLIGNAVFDYISLLSTRYALTLLTKYRSIIFTFTIMLADLAVTFILGSIGGQVGQAMFAKSLPGLWLNTRGHPESIPSWQMMTQNLYMMLHHPRILFTFINLGTIGTIWIVSASFTSLWLWLYAGSGFLLKASRRFDIGFQWFNRKFDIEKKPLYCIGLVAGAIVAVVYWTVMVVGHFSYEASPRR